MSKAKAKQYAKQISELIQISKEMAEINGVSTIPIKIDYAPVIAIPVDALDGVAQALITQNEIDLGVRNPDRLNDTQFDALAKIAKLQPGSNKYTAAYRHLVNGEAAKDIAPLLEMSYTNAWDAIKAAKAKIALCRVVAGHE